MQRQPFKPVTRRHVLGRSLLAGAAGAAFLREGWSEIVEAAQTRAVGKTPEEAAADEDYWREIQQAFAVDRSLINFNNGGVSPSARVVHDALRRHLEFANNAPARHMWQLQDPGVEVVRKRLAAAFGCSSEEMAITRNASESLQICIYGMELRAGDEILAADLDYPRMLNTYRQRELREGVVLKTVPLAAPCDDPANLVAAYSSHLTAKTRVMLCSHVINITGQIMPVREIVRLGRERGIPVIVDGAHAFAQLYFKRDDLECDYYGVSLHKWLTAPIGTGFLYVRRDKIEPLWPLMAAVKPKSGDIRKFEEIGTHPAANFLAIAEALAFHDGIGPQRREARLRYLRDRWAQRLMQDKRVRLYARPEPRHSSAIGTLTIEGVDNAKLSEHLFAKHRVITTFIDHATVKGIRVTPNVYSTLDEVDLFCEAVEDVLANGLPA